MPIDIVTSPLPMRFISPQSKPYSKPPHRRCAAQRRFAFAPRFPIHPIKKAPRVSARGFSIFSVAG
ncbi:hypothetical protein C8N31_1045 [Sulfitobacter mediterraneus]|uniref:Uncharacterized protein n=1 Tax=Sulfitobacter mediterraneus TaxID=83219 RepID=A0A2T6CF42_9RHOB|nr:hypothetical protein C8N31_1045 [Sulfitobacter mediterraneus]